MSIAEKIKIPLLGIVGLVLASMACNLTSASMPVFIPTSTPAIISTQTSANTAAPTYMPTTLNWIHTDGNVLLDSLGRTIILRGFVMITHFDAGRDELLYTPEDYARMQSLGSNYQSIRLFAGWIGAWPGYAPHQGYLDKLDRMVLLAKEEGMYTSFKLTPYDLPGIFNRERHKHIWGDFWRNENGEQEAWIDAWKCIWEHYKDEPEVIGYDLLNEPHIGDLGVSEEVFVQDYLTPFYQKTIDELRTIDSKHLALIQPGFGGVAQDTGDIIYLSYNIPVERPNVGYAPHFYINFIRHKEGVYFPERYQSLLDRYIREARLHNAPLILGEMGEFWLEENDGNIKREEKFRRLEDIQIGLFDEAMIGFSRPVWANDRSAASAHNTLKGRTEILGEDRTIITDIFTRPFPQQTAGTLESFSFDLDISEFTLTYTPDSDLGTTEIFIPFERHYQEGFTLKHSAGIILNFDPSIQALKVASNTIGIGSSRFSYDEATSVLSIHEWLQGESTIIEIVPLSPSTFLLPSDTNPFSSFQDSETSIAI